MKHPTQEEMILIALKNAGSTGIHPTYIIEDLHIFQYNARINNLRKRFNCECKNGIRCCSSEHIINRRLSNGTTKFFYENTTRNWEKDREEAVERMHEIPVINSDQLSLV